MLTHLVAPDIEMWPIERLVEYPRNPRQNDAAVDRMCASIREFGFKIPCLLRGNGEIVDGHLRLKAARKLGIAEIPVILCDEWTPTQVKAFRLMVNRSVTWADWDEELLALELQEIQESDYDLSLTGFDPGEIDGLLTLEDDEKANAAPPLPDTPVSRAGDLWLLGDHRVLCGDATSAEVVARLLGGVRVCHNCTRSMPAKRPPLPTYRLKVTLIEIKPPIWRRIQVPASIKLCCLHSAIQVAMGWTDSHLHQWEKDTKNWGVPEWDEFDEPDLIDESKTRLADMLRSEGESMVYVYDFGDDWRHNVVLESIAPVKEVVKTPICDGGERRCPPEDVGGVWGYEEFLEALLDPHHENYEQYVRWAGGHFIDDFDLEAANLMLAGMRWPVRHSW
jgi:hypothetical protein